MTMGAGYDAAADKLLQEVGKVPLGDAEISVEIRSYNDREPRIAVVKKGTASDGHAWASPKIGRLGAKEAAALSTILGSASTELTKLIKKGSK